MVFHVQRGKLPGVDLREEAIGGMLLGFEVPPLHGRYLAGRVRNHELYITAWPDSWGGILTLYTPSGYPLFQHYPINDLRVGLL